MQLKKLCIGISIFINETKVPKEERKEKHRKITVINDPEITQCNIINRNNYKRVFTIFMTSKRKRLPTMLLRSS